MSFFKHKKEDSGKERRQHARLYNSPELYYQTANNPQLHTCRVQDISEGGVRVALFEKLPVGTVIKLCIYLLSGSADQQWLLGKVVWVCEVQDREHPYEVGVVFDFFDPAFREKIQQYIQKLINEKK